MCGPAEPGDSGLEKQPRWLRSSGHPLPRRRKASDSAHRAKHLSLFLMVGSGVSLHLIYVRLVTARLSVFPGA